MKTIHLEDSKYSIKYDPKKQYDFRIFRCGEDVTSELKSNVMFDLVFWLTENIEHGAQLEGIEVTED